MKEPWADRVAVVPGNGYVAHNYWSDEFVRIWVSDYITGATTGGVIGAEVKCQKPFRGLDEAISLKQDKVVFPVEGGTQELVFDNSSIVPFKVTSSAGWCRVEKGSTRNESFLYDAVVLSCDETFSAEEATATVTVETLFGKTKEITVTRAARGEFIVLSQEECNLGFVPSQQQFSVNVFTNVEPSDIKVTSSNEWLRGEFSGRNYMSERCVRCVRWVGDQPLSRATLENPVSQDFIVIADGYAGADMREGTIILSYGNERSVLKVTQQGSEFRLSESDFTFMAEEELTQTATWSGNLDAYQLYADIPDEAGWVSVKFSYGKMTVNVTPNPFEESRSAVIKLCYDYNGDERMMVSEIGVKQEGAVPYDRYVYFESTASNYTVSFPITEGAKVTSSADWCTATPDGSTLVVRATAATENRWAEISVEGVSSKIYVSQSKYKVGDTYTEGAVTGQVYSMEQGEGRITQELVGKYAWSTENVDIKGATDYNDGTKNMEAIKAIPGWKELYPAFAAVEALNVNGATGWYLPAVWEMTYNGSWSSTQCSATEALLLGYDRYGYSKIGQNRIVAMNRFSFNFVQK